MKYRIMGSSGGSDNNGSNSEEKNKVQKMNVVTEVQPIVAGGDIRKNGVKKAAKVKENGYTAMMVGKENTMSTDLDVHIGY